MDEPIADDGPLAAYERLLRAGELRPDADQRAAAQTLQELCDALRDHRPKAAGRRSKRPWKRRQGGGAAPRGVYLHGPVGRGKSMLMDMAFAGAPVAAKRRVHFHAFMLDVHARLHRRREAGVRQDDALEPVARELAQAAWFLCFDEFQVTDVVDAMVLARLFRALFAQGVVVVATSNHAPRRLYEHGLQRERFVPFIELLEEHLEVVALDGGRDYRRLRLRDVAVYHAPLGPETDAKLDAAFATLTDDDEGGPAEVAVGGRRLKVPRAARGVACFTFAELCGRPLGAADYLALAERFHTVILAGVPRLRPDQRNEAARFVTLVDALYERRRNLVIGAEVPPEALYADGDGAFAFQRTVSRLHEMQTGAYVADARTAAEADDDLVNGR